MAVHGCVGGATDSANSAKRPGRFHVRSLPRQTPGTTSGLVAKFHRRQGSRGLEAWQMRNYRHDATMHETSRVQQSLLAVR